MSSYAAKVHCFLLYKKLNFETFCISPFRLKQIFPWQPDPRSPDRRRGAHGLQADWLAPLNLSLPDFSAYPQFALYYQVGFRGAEDILEASKLVDWLMRMKPYVIGNPPMLSKWVYKQEMS